MSGVVEPSPRRRNRRIGCLGTLLAFMLLGGILVVLGDGVAKGYAEEQLTAEIVAATSDAGASGPAPEVVIEGTPFLDQVIRGRYDGVRVRQRNVGAGGLVARQLDVHATGIRLPFSELMAARSQDRPPRNIRADRVTVTAIIAVRELAEAVQGRGITLKAEQDKIRVTVPVSVAGFRSTVTGLADLEVVAGGRLRIKLSKLEAAGVDLPQAVADAVSSQVGRFIEGPRLPFGLRLREVRVVGQDIVAAASGRDVLLTG